MYRAFCGRPAFRVLARVPAFSYSVPYVCGSSRRMGSTSTTAGMEPRPVFFFDIDNCLYSKSHNVHAEMEKLINSFFVRHLALDPEDAHMLHQKYYKEYGLALEGLTRHHKVDPLKFNYEVDDALPMDKILKPDPKLRALIEDIDQSKVKLWLLTNAYVNHAKRVVKLLQIDDLFEGVTFCDYSQYPLICKPNQEMYKRAEADAGAPGPDQCYFVDDSHLNCKHAEARGWTTVHFVESGQPIPRIPACKYMVHRLEDLRVHFPHLFKSTSGQTSG